ncbi:MAG: hypothetical protein RLZZ435_2251 [Cyanobacteriota bacterium]|jgi:hypothetical protein
MCKLGIPPSTTQFCNDMLTNASDSALGSGFSITFDLPGLDEIAFNPESGQRSFLTQLPHIVQQAQDTLQTFQAASSFASGVQLAFGTSVDLDAVHQSINEILAGNGPEIQVVDRSVLGTAQGAFGNNTVFLRDDLLNPGLTSFSQGVGVLLEEWGHWIDRSVNGIDAVGDEGARFARVVVGDEVSGAEWAALQAENDHGVLTFNGSSIAVEFADEPGLFTVGESSSIRFDLLADAGGYRGELAIVSLTGMENLERGSTAFIEEAARRALSNETGFIVFSDATEGARFSGELGEANQNSGNHGGTKTLTFAPGTEVFFMLVPNGTIAEVLDNPNVTGDKRPLFSLADANPDGAEQFGQLGTNGGNWSTFGFEDLVGNSDKDFNDLLFRVEGLEGSDGTGARLDEYLPWATDPHFYFRK